VLSLLLFCGVVLIVAGVLVWGVNNLTALDPTIAQALRVLIIVGAVLWCVLTLYHGRAAF
jgi:hypothetical protein